MTAEGKTAAKGGSMGAAVAPRRPTGPAIHLVLVEPAVVSGLDSRCVASDNPAVDPVIAALAQLVRDRYERELAEKAARRHRLRVLEGKSS